MCFTTRLTTGAFGAIGFMPPFSMVRLAADAFAGCPAIGNVVADENGSLADSAASAATISAPRLAAAQSVDGSRRRERKPPHNPPMQRTDAAGGGAVKSTVAVAAPAADRPYVSRARPYAAGG